MPRQDDLCCALSGPNGLFSFPGRRCALPWAGMFWAFQDDLQKGKGLFKYRAEQYWLRPLISTIIITTMLALWSATAQPSLWIS